MGYATRSTAMSRRAYEPGDTKRPRRYQLLAARAAIRALAERDSTTIAMPWGGGKTRAGILAAERLSPAGATSRTSSRTRGTLSWRDANGNAIADEEAGRHAGESRLGRRDITRKQGPGLSGRGLHPGAARGPRPRKEGHAGPATRPSGAPLREGWS